MRVVFHLAEARGPGKPLGRKSPKNGKELQLPLPGPTPETREKLPQKGVKLLRKYNFCTFSVIFPHFRVSDRGGEFCNFSPFFGNFQPGGFPGPVRGKQLAILGTTAKVKNYRNFIFEVVFPLSGAIFRIFGGQTGGGELCNFAAFPPRRIPGRCKGKNIWPTLQCHLEERKELRPWRSPWQARPSNPPDHQDDGKGGLSLRG